MKVEDFVITKITKKIDQQEEQFILNCISSCKELNLGSNNLKSNQIKKIYLENKNLTIDLRLPYFIESNNLEELKERLKLSPNIDNVVIKNKAKILESNLTQKANNLRSISNIIAISSGKGGVGKSTVAFNIAKYMNLKGLKVGILDADIHGPSIPTLTDTVNKKISINKQDQFNPIISNGIAIQSIGFLVSPDSAQIWRGLVAVKTLMQLINETKWPDLDYLILDLPPGTGDIPLSLCQNINLTGAVVVTTPHELAIADVKKSISMFNKVNVNILGLINNMSYHKCSKCNTKDYIFGSKDISEIAKERSIQVLGSLPLFKDSQSKNKIEDEKIKFYGSISNKILLNTYNAFSKKNLNIKVIEKR